MKVAVRSGKMFFATWPLGHLTTWPLGHFAKWRSGKERSEAEKTRNTPAPIGPFRGGRGHRGNLGSAPRPDARRRPVTLRPGLPPRPEVRHAAGSSGVALAAG